MATSLRNLTRVGTDLRQIAALLRSKGRYGDTVLAHINPQEAALLKARGGAGTPNPETGLPEFFAGDYDFPQESEMQQETPVAESFPVLSEGYGAVPETFSPPQEISGYQGFPEDAQGSYPVQMPEEFRVSAPEMAAKLRAQPPFELGVPPEAQPPAMPELQAPQVPAAGGLSEEMKKRLGIAGIQALGAGMLGGRASRQAQQAQQQISQLGAPYRAKGAELMGLAQQGQLTAVTQQQLNALRAQLAQRQAGRGGVGAAQSAQQVENFRQQLLAQQYDLGLKLSGISDQYALQAIKQGLSADQAVNQMLGSAMSNIGRIFAGQPAPQTPTPPGGG